MTLADIFEQLTYGELAQLDMGGLTGGEVPEHRRKQVIAHVNLALTALYKRFWLSSRELVIYLYDHIQVYRLEKKYAMSCKLSAEPYKYIMDSESDPFQEDVLKIEQVFNGRGELLPLNDQTEAWSLYTPTWNSIQIPLPIASEILLVQYRANHPRIRFDPDMDPCQVDIHLPEGLLQALLFYVASRVFASLNVADKQEDVSYMQKYEAFCKQAEAQGLQITPDYGNVRLDINQWV